MAMPWPLPSGGREQCSLLMLKTFILMPQSVMSHKTGMGISKRTNTLISCELSFFIMMTSASSWVTKCQ